MSIVLWAQEAVLLMLGLYWTVWDMYMQVLYMGRALRTKETLPDFLKWRRVTRHPLVFRGLTGSQRTSGFGASQSNIKWCPIMWDFSNGWLASNCSFKVDGPNTTRTSNL